MIWIIISFIINGSNNILLWKEIKIKIIKIKIFTEDYSGKKAIFSVDVTYKNLSIGEFKKIQEYKGREQFLDSKELGIKTDEYLIDFHIKKDGEYISQLVFTTNKQ